MEIKIKNVSEWKSVLNAIGDIVEEAMFICNDDGIIFRGIDVAHIALLEVVFPKSSFEKFEPKISFFGLNINDFKNIMNSASQGDEVEFQIKDDSSTMKIFIQGLLNMEYSIRLIERSEVNTPLPHIDARSKISISSTAFTRIVNNIEKISDYITIESLSDKIHFSGKGDVGDAKIDLEKSHPDLSILDVSEDSLSMYRIDYMAKIIRNIGKSCNSINMEYGTQTPIKMLFEMPSMTKVEYYLAPRVEP